MTVVARAPDPSNSRKQFVPISSSSKCFCRFEWCLIESWISNRLFTSSEAEGEAVERPERFPGAVFWGEVAGSGSAILD